jgi:hypothetical protein
VNAAPETTILTLISKELVNEWNLTLDQIERIAADLPGECEHYLAAKSARDEAERNAA